MNPFGRYHWTETITVGSWAQAAMDPNNPAGDRPYTFTADPNRTNLTASVQSMDRRAVIESALDTTREWWWIRVGPEAAPVERATTRILWRGKRLVIESVNAIPGEDLELTVTTDA